MALVLPPRWRTPGRAERFPRAEPIAPEDAGAAHGHSPPPTHESTGPGGRQACVAGGRGLPSDTVP